MAPRRRRTQYERIAGAYDVISAEFVYRTGRRAAIELMRLPPGATVLDVGCGTGLNWPQLQRAVGPVGRVVGLDASSAMLSRAAARARREGWTNVVLLEADATATAAQSLLDLLGGPVDAALATYSLSLMREWRAAWRLIASVCRAGARLAVVDMEEPQAIAPCRWAARAACRLGGSEISARPWTALEAECRDVQHAAAWAGHIQIRVGTQRFDEGRLGLDLHQEAG